MSYLLYLLKLGMNKSYHLLSKSYIFLEQIRIKFDKLNLLDFRNIESLIDNKLYLKSYKAIYFY